MTITRKFVFKIGIALLLLPLGVMGIVVIGDPHTYQQLLAISSTLLKVRLAIIIGACFLIYQVLRHQSPQIQQVGKFALGAFLIMAFCSELLIELG